jgi:ketosteroid isomerase-like protein
MTGVTGLALCSLALLGSASAHAAAPTAEEQLRSLEQEWVNAEIRRDAVTLRRILDEKFIATFGAGPPLNRDAFIHAIVSGTDTDVSQTLSDSTILTDGDTAVVAGIDTVRGVANGVPYTHAYRYTATYIRRGGRWIALAEHLARIPEAK